MKFLNADWVLCLAPHPDDVAYAMAGAVLTCTDTHFDIFSLSIGSEQDPSASVDRREEQRYFWKDIVNSSVYSSPWSYISRASEEDWLVFLDQYIGKYDLILCPSSYDSHYEHRLVAGMCTPATRTLPIGIVEFRTPSTLTTWIPNYFLNLQKSVYRHKCAQLRVFESQQNRGYFNSDALEVFHRSYTCLKRGLAYVEEFRIVQLYTSEVTQ